MSEKIVSVRALEILDSRGNPTLRALERSKTEQEAGGEIEIHQTGYLGAHDT